MLYMRFLSVLLIAIQMIAPMGLGLAFAQEGGLFDFSIESETKDTSLLALHDNASTAVLDSGTAEEIKEYMGTRTKKERSSIVMQMAHTNTTDCCEHIRDTLSPGDFAQLLNGVTEDAAMVLLPDGVVESYVIEHAAAEKNEFFTHLNTVHTQRVVTSVSSDKLHDVLLELSDTNQQSALESMSQQELDTFVEEENENGMGGVLLVGLGAAAALYLLSTASVPVAAAATAGLQTANGVSLVPYGGRSLAMVPCTCTPGFFLVAVGPPRPGLFMYGPGTLLFAWRNIAPPAYQLGKASVPLPCLVYTGGACLPVGTGLYVIMAGTSLM
jgi:hypothetical protein